MQSNLTVKDLVPTIKEVISKNKTASFTPYGNSMWPMLKSGKSEVLLKKPSFPLKKGDLPLYIRADGFLVLHRLIKFNGVTYTMRGDNTWSNETDISEENIIGVVTKFKHVKRWISVTNPFYRLYFKLWLCIYPIRRFFYILFYKFKKIIKKTSQQS